MRKGGIVKRRILRPMSRNSLAADPAPVFADVFAALGDMTRLQLLSRLSDGREYSIVQLADGLDLTRQGVTKHLHVLRRAGVVSAQKIGRETRFAITPEPLVEARDYLTRAAAQWDEAAARLKTFVEE